jgi:predicted O-methyltransferase YrrM
MKAAVIRIGDLALAPFTLMSAVLLKTIRYIGVQRMPVSRRVLRRVGVFPIRNHYYEPMVDPAHLDIGRLHEPRRLPGIDMNVATQLAILKSFNYADELSRFPLEGNPAAHTFYYRNGAYGSGDAEFLYSMIRKFRPARMIEIGSGFSTLIAREAIRANTLSQPGYVCNHVCIEPYEVPWLEEIGVRVIRDCVEHVEESLFAALEKNDILFVDSSHVIRPQGDVLKIYQQIVPTLASGVLIHSHDIFTPRDYPEEWICERVLLWNEQYLLESFLSFNPDYEIVGAVNYLAHHFQTQLAKKCPTYAQEVAMREPGAFWFRRL